MQICKYVNSDSLRQLEQLVSILKAELELKPRFLIVEYIHMEWALLNSRYLSRGPKGDNTLQSISLAISCLNLEQVGKSGLG